MTNTEPLRVLMAAGVTRRREGGVAAVIYNLGAHLQSRGHSVSYLFYDDLMTSSESASRFRDLKFAYRLARHIQRDPKKYSVVNLHAPVGWLYGLTRKLSRSERLPPYVMTLHGLEERRIHVMTREAKKGRAWNFSLKNRLWHRVYHRPRFWLSIRTADAAHCFSRDVWTILQLKYDMDTEKVAYIRNGVEERFFTPRQYHDRKPVRLLYAGTWLDQRGIYYLRDALINLNKSFRDWTLTIAGAGVSAEELREFFGTSLHRQIVPLAVVPADGMPQVYSEHDVLVFPSLMEGLPCVLLEAMAGGLAVVTTDTCGMSDVVQNGVNGLSVRPADATSLKNALFQVCNSADLRQRIGSAAQHCMRAYDWVESAKQLEGLFRSVVEEWGANNRDAVSHAAQPDSVMERSR